MNKAGIFARTAKGDRELAAATHALPRDLRRVLEAIDGKSTLDVLRDALADLSATDLDEALAALVGEDLIRDAADVADAESAAAPDDESLRQAQALRAKIKARRDGVERVSPETEAREPQSEAQALREAEERTQRETEKRVQREAEEGAQRETEAQARREAAEQAQQEAAEAARREEAEIARQEAEAQARWREEEKAWREAEEKTRREQEAAARKRADARAAAHGGGSDRTFLAKWGKTLALGFFFVLALGLVTLHLISFDGQIPQFEKALAAQFRQPVKIEALHLSLLPQTQLRLDRVWIGAEGQIRIPRIKAVGGLGNLFSQKKVFKSLEIESPQVNEEGLGWILFGAAPAGDVEFGQVGALNATLDSKNLSLPPFDAKLTLGEDGAWSGVTIETTDKNIGLELERKGESLQIGLNAKSFKIPFGSALTVEDLVAKGTVNRAGLSLAEFKAFVYGGTLSGNASLKWDAGWSLAGQLAAKQIDAARLLPELLDGARLEGTASYAMQAAEAGKLFAAPRLEGSFVIPRGTLLGADLGRLLQGGGVRGDTMFTDLAAGFVHERGATQLRQLRLSQGALSASGMADVDAERNVRGQLALSLKLPSSQLGARFTLGGTLKHLEWRR